MRCLEVKSAAIKQISIIPVLPLLLSQKRWLRPCVHSSLLLLKKEKEKEKMEKNEGETINIYLLHPISLCIATVECGRGIKVLLHKLSRKHNFPNSPSSSINNSEHSFSHITNPCVHYWPKGRDYEFSRHRLRRSTASKLV